QSHRVSRADNEVEGRRLPLVAVTALLTRTSEASTNRSRSGTWKQGTRRETRVPPWRARRLSPALSHNRGVQRLTRERPAAAGSGRRGVSWRLLRGDPRARPPCHARR